MPTLRLLPGDLAVEVATGTRLIDAIRGAGRPIAAPCGDELICGRCGVRILSGEVRHESQAERDAKARNRVPVDQRLACALRVQGDLVLTATYWGEVPGPRALLLVDHGSRRPEAHAHLEELARAIGSRRPHLRIYLAHMELAEPSIATALESAAREGVLALDVLPLFLAPGRHVTHDLPERIQEARDQHPDLDLRVLSPLGERRELADWILEALTRDRRDT